MKFDFFRIYSFINSSLQWTFRKYFDVENSKLIIKKEPRPTLLKLLDKTVCSCWDWEECGIFGWAYSPRLVPYGALRPQAVSSRNNCLSELHENEAWFQISPQAEETPSPRILCHGQQKCRVLISGQNAPATTPSRGFAHHWVGQTKIDV